MALFATTFGFLSGTYALMMVVPADLLGEELFGLSYGFLLAAEGVGVYLGPPLVGMSHRNSCICFGFLTEPETSKR